MEDMHVGTSLGEHELPEVAFPEPMVGLAISPSKRGDENKLSAAMHKLTEEDPTLKLSRDPQTAEMVMTGTSELHLQILRERLARRDHIEVNTHDPRIPYRETITQSPKVLTATRNKAEDADNSARSCSHDTVAARNRYRDVRNQGSFPINEESSLSPGVKFLMGGFDRRWCDPWQLHASDRKRFLGKDQSRT